VLKSSLWQTAYNLTNKYTVVEVPATRDAKHRVAFYRAFAEGVDANVSAGQHRVSKMQPTAHIHVEVGADVGGRVHIHTLYPKTRLIGVGVSRWSKPYSAGAGEFVRAISWCGILPI